MNMAIAYVIDDRTKTINIEKVKKRNAPKYRMARFPFRKVYFMHRDLNGNIYDVNIEIFADTLLTEIK
jgi:hypothetical protein